MSASHTFESNMSKYDRHLAKLSRLKLILRDRYHVTVSELAFGLSFLLSFIMGKIIHLTSSDEEVSNYYNNKNNLINQYFVKQGWFWTTLAIVLFYSIILTKSQYHLSNGKKKSEVIKSGVIKYIFATIWWILFTQWCFGLPIMDKVYILTGGKCSGINVNKDVTKFPKFVLQKLTEIEGSNELFESKSITSYTCRKLGGSWVGGHDPSGHVFLLVHSSMYMFLESALFWKSWMVFKSSIAKLIQGVKARDMLAISQFILETPHIIIMGLCALWWFMLFMTNIYFHSLAEKLVGLGFGYLGVFIVYFLPRWN